MFCFSLQTNSFPTSQGEGPRNNSKGTKGDFFHHRIFKGSRVVYTEQYYELKINGATCKLNNEQFDSRKYARLAMVLILDGISEPVAHA